MSLRENAGKEFSRHSYWMRAFSLLSREIMESFSSFSTMTPSMGAQRAAWTNTATEAMACGTPVVAFRTGGLPEIVNDGISGWLADAFEPEDLAKCIAAVIANPDKQRAMAHKARQQAEARWHPKGIAARYAEVYDEALERFQ